MGILFFFERTATRQAVSFSYGLSAFQRTTAPRAVNFSYGHSAFQRTTARQAVNFSYGLIFSAFERTTAPKAVIPELCAQNPSGQYFDFGQSYSKSVGGVIFLCPSVCYKQWTR